MFGSIVGVKGSSIGSGLEFNDDESFELEDELSRNDELFKGSLSEARLDLLDIY
jgi:hypothetical protein